MSTEAPDVTALLLAWRAGDPQAFESLVPLVYEDLRRAARSQLRRGARDSLLDTTGLVHEAYLRLVDGARVEWQDRGHFMAVATRAMRQVVVEYARRRLATKRGGGVQEATLDEEGLAVSAHSEQLLAIHQALQSLGEYDARLERIAECRFFAGLSARETADALGIGLRTAQRDWTRAQAWLRQSLHGGAGSNLAPHNSG